MFERFTEEARATVRLAQEEARRLRHPRIGTEHILLGLLDESRGPAARALRDHGLTAADLRQRVLELTEPDALDPEALAAIGIDIEQVRAITESAFGPGALDSPAGSPKGHIRFSRRAKKVLELSLIEAARLGHKHISTGHILLGLLREAESDGVAARALVAAGADLEALRTQVARHIPDRAA